MSLVEIDMNPVFLTLLKTSIKSFVSSFFILVTLINPKATDNSNLVNQSY